MGVWYAGDRSAVYPPTIQPPRMGGRSGQATLEWLGATVACFALVATSILGLRAWAGAHRPVSGALGQAAAVRPLVDSGTATGALMGGGPNGLIARIALAQEARGIREISEDDAPAIMAFTQGNREPWCADFVSWVLRAAGKPLRQGVSGWRVAGAESIRSIFLVRHRFVDRAFAQPEPGDIVVYHYPWSWHVGIVITATGATLTTVEGNSGSERGLEALVRHERTGWRANPWLVGFARP